MQAAKFVLSAAEAVVILIKNNFLISSQISQNYNFMVILACSVKISPQKKTDNAMIFI